MLSVYHTLYADDLADSQIFGVVCSVLVLVRENSSFGLPITPLMPAS